MISLKTAKKTATKTHPGRMVYVGWWKDRARAPYRVPPRIRAKVLFMTVGPF